MYGVCGKVDIITSLICKAWRFLRERHHRPFSRIAFDRHCTTLVRVLHTHTYTTRTHAHTYTSHTQRTHSPNVGAGSTRSAVSAHYQSLARLKSAAPLIFSQKPPTGVTLAHGGRSALTINQPEPPPPLPPRLLLPRPPLAEESLSTIHYPRLPD
jgi:hypothetical protein